MVNHIISFIVPALYLIGFTVSLVVLTKRSFGKCLPVTLMLSAFLLFFSQLFFGTFNVGFVLGILFSVSSTILLIWKRKEIVIYKGLIFSSGFFVFLIIYLIVFIYDFSRGFSTWDEFSHWGMMVKEMARLDKFYSVDASNLMVHKDYPPIIQLFELFWVKLCGGYNEVWLERSLHTFELSLIIPFIVDRVAKKKFVVKSFMIGAISVGLTMLTILFFDQHGVLATIYTDYLMALVVVFLIMTIFVNKDITWFGIANLMIGGSFLLLLKQMGLPLYVMVLCVFVGLVWLRKKTTWRKLFCKVGVKKLVFVVIALLVPFVLWLVWGRLVSDTSKQFDLSSISLSKFIEVFFGRGETWQRPTMKKFIMALGQESISTSYIQISYLQSIALFIGLIWIVWNLFKKHIIKNELLLVSVILILGAFGYAFAMMILYVLSFGPNEGPELASFNRYMGTYSIIMMLFVVFVIVWQGTLLRNWRAICALLIGLIIVNTPAALERVYPRFSFDSKDSKYKDISEEIKPKIEEGKSVFMVTQDNSLAGGFYMQYYLNTNRMNYGLSTWSTNDKKEYESSIMPVVARYDYLVILDETSDFKKNYCGDVIKECSKTGRGLYKVVIDESGSVSNYDLLLEF